MFNRVAFCCFLLLSESHAQPSSIVDEELQRTIDAVSQAAVHKDYDALEGLMVENFTYSFGGSRQRNEALAWYRKYPALLDKMVEVLSRECAFTDAYGKTRYICPIEATDFDKPYYEHRATFSRNGDGTWILESFVAGD